MTAVRLAAVIVATCAAMALCGCGGSGQTRVPPHAASQAVLARVDATCRQLRREVAELGRGALSGSSSIPELITERLVKPSIPLLERVAGHQQALAARSGDPKLALYAALFEPIIVLAQERLRTGRASERPGHAEAAVLSRGYETLMTSVATEQRKVAREAGARACAINFEHVLTSSLSG
jgi:hypothetical protein